MNVNNIKYDTFFINLKTLPDRGTEERKELRKRERDRCIGGVHVDDVFISGWLYWHINYWWITDDIQDEYDNIVPFESVASLRDNEWLRSEALERCRTHENGLQGYIEVGLRQGGKTTLESSIISYNATLFKKSQNIIVSGSDDDLNNIKLRLNYGLGKIWDGLRKPRLTKDKRAKEITLGYKDKDNEDIIWSHIIIRNIAEGQNTEGPAGVTAKSFIMDEIGKAPFSQALEAAKPAFMSKYGWRAIPILVGTGGSFEKGADAERIFYNPEANNFLSFIHEETGERTGFFMPGTFRTDCKYQTNLAEYLKQLGRIPEGTYPELSKIPISVSDKVKALEKIKTDREKKARDPDQTEYRKLIMYFPLTPNECFLSSSDNFYNSGIAEKQKAKLEQDYPGLRVGMYVELEDEGDKIVHKPSKKLPISSFPVKPKEDKDTPIVILEHPISQTPPYGLYVGGCDSYVFDDAGESALASLGTLYIFKRMYDVLSDSFQDMLVAWYVGRPKEKSTWNKNAKLLIKYFNAITLCENDEMSFINYMIAEGQGHMMMDTPDWIKEFMPTSGFMKRPKGISRQNEKVQKFLRGTLKQYMEETFVTVPIQGSNETRKILGVNKIYDPMLLEEIIKWNKDGNFDREVAASLAITAARKMDEQRIGVSDVQEDEKEKRVERKQRVMFKELGSTYKYDTRTRLNKLLK